MLETSSNSLNILISIFIYSWVISVVYGLIISISYPIFKKVGNDESGIFVPLYNLFLLCDLNGYSQKYGLLFLIPVVNVIMIMLMSFKLKDTFNTSGTFSIGLLLLPFPFIPILAHGKYGNNEVEERVKEKVEEKAEEPEEEVVDSNVDSIFKTSLQTKELDNKPYKAKRVQVNEKFINSAPAKAEKIEKIKK